MSILSKIVGAGRALISSPIGKVVGAALGGPIGTVLTAASTAYGAYQALKPQEQTPMPGGAGLSGLPTMGMGLGLSPATVGRAAGVAVGAARNVGKAAVNLCRKYPQWCSTIGGTVAVEALLHSGQLPMPKRRRGRGITAGELRSFKRVAKFTSRYCAPVHRAMKAPAVRGGKSCR